MAQRLTIEAKDLAPHDFTWVYDAYFGSQLMEARYVDVLHCECSDHDGPRVRVTFVEDDREWREFDPTERISVIR